MKYILETHNLVKKYKNFEALSNFNMHIPRCAIYGLIGKNGAGKTTVFRVICGLQKPSKGSYSIYGISNTDHQIMKTRKRMGAIIEVPAVRIEANAEETLKEQYRILGLPSWENVNEVLNLVGLQNTGKKKIKDFSLGMKQRLGIAIALVGNPDFLILDEPINGLDPEGIIEIRELILKLNKEKQITFLISSHYLDELSKIATHYGFVNQGKMIKEISSEELRKNCKKKTQIEVSNIKEATTYLEEQDISYEVISKKQINIYTQVNVSELALALAKRKCIIDKFHESEESLENYYINIIGGDQNV